MPEPCKGAGKGVKIMKNGWLRGALALIIALTLALPSAWAEVAEEADPVLAESVEDAEELGEIDLYDPSVYAEEVPADDYAGATPVPEPTGAPEETPTEDAAEASEETQTGEAAEVPEETPAPEIGETAEPTPETTAVPEATAEAELIAPKATQTPKALAFPKKSLKLGRGERLLWTARTPDGTEVTGVKYVSSKPSVVEVDAKGNLHARKKGAAKITATAANGVKCACKVKVVKAPSKVRLSTKKLTLCVDQARKLKVKLPSKTASTIIWTSSNPGVVTVDAAGNAKGVAAGTAVITAKTFNGKKARCAVTVLNGRAPTTLTLPSKTITMGIKEKLRLEPKVGQGEATLFTYSSSRKRVAAVSKGGMVTAKRKGTAKITVKTHNGLKVRLTVKVVKAPSKVTLSKTSLNMAVGETVTLKAALPSGTSSDITWKSSDETVAAVDGKGNVLGLNPGTARVTASTFNGKSASCDVTVTQAQSTPVVSQTRPSNAQMAANIANDKSLGKKRTATAQVIEFMLNNGYEPAFVAGFCANAYNEGQFGLFESSKYVANYQKRPRYFCYLDGGEYYTLKDGKYVLTAVYLSPEEIKTYTGPAEARQRFGPEKYYWNKWSGKYVWEINLDELYALLKQLSAGGWKGKFGVGITQWTGGRVSNLIKRYRKYATPGSTTITPEQAAKAEMEMILWDLKGDYKKVYDAWKKENAAALDCVESARSAGSIVCLKYAIPANKEQSAITRGKRAAKFYKIMMGIK